ncbi:MAG: hypothetical protein WC758_03835 [Candidatus Woesearchaeota archaeon]
MKNRNNKTLGTIVAGLILLCSINGCKKDDLEYSTNGVWKTFGSQGYLFTEKNEGKTNILGLKNIPELKGEIMIYDFNNNRRFDYNQFEFYPDGAQIYDSIPVAGRKKIFDVVDIIHSNSIRAGFVDSLMLKYLPILKDSVAEQKSNLPQNF